MATKRHITSLRAFLKSLSAASLANISSLAMLYLSQLVIARLLGVENYGVYHYVLSWLVIAVLTGKMGMDLTLQRYLPHYKINGQWSLFRGLILNAYFTSFIASLAVTSILYFGLTLLTAKSSPALFKAFIVGLAVIPVWTAYKITQGSLLALKHPALSQVTDGVVQPAILLVLIYAVYSQNHGTITAANAMTLNFIAWGVALFLSIWILINRAPRSSCTNSPEFRIIEWYRYAIPALVISAMQIAMNNTDIIMIGILRDTTEAGIYAVSARLAALVSLGLILINMVLVPYISEYYHGDRIYDLQQITTLGTRIASILATIVFLLLYILGSKLLGLFGNAFVAGDMALVILSAGFLINVACGSVGFLMSMTGHQKQAAIFLGSSMLLNITMNLILIPKYGIKGAAIATSTSMIVWNTGMAVYLVKKININPTLLTKLRRP